MEMGINLQFNETFVKIKPEFNADRFLSMLHCKCLAKLITYVS